MEIYTDNDGEIIFKKYSPVGEITKYAEQYADVLHRSSGYQTVITDRDSVIACTGTVKRDILGKAVGEELETLMDNRTHYVTKHGTDGEIRIVDGYDKNAAVVSPIVSGGDVIGCICFVKEEGKLPSETDVKLVQTAAQFIAKQMEE